MMKELYIYFKKSLKVHIAKHKGISWPVTDFYIWYKLSLNFSLVFNGWDNVDFQNYYAIERMKWFFLEDI